MGGLLAGLAGVPANKLPHQILWIAIGPAAGSA